MRIDIYDSPGGDSGRYRGVLNSQCAALGINLDLGEPQVGTAAAVTLVFAGQGSHWTDAQELALQRLVDASALVLPVIESRPRREIPAAGRWQDQCVQEARHWRCMGGQPCGRNIEHGLA